MTSVNFSSATTIRIIGIDPGSRFTGFGIIEKDGNRLRRITSGVIDCSRLDNLEEKLEQIYDGLSEVIKTYSPHQGSVERIFHSVNAHSSLVLGHARGVALLALKKNNIVIHEYAPNAIKSALVGVGRASKEQVGSMVKILLNFRDKTKEDETDALAAAVCHANTFDFALLSTKKFF